MSRVFNRHGKGNQLDIGDEAGVFSAAGVAEVTDVAAYLTQPGVEAAGEPGLFWDILTAGNATLVATVPAGKYWRPISAVMRITADANAANRLGVATSRTAADATIKALTQTSAVTANQDLVRHFVYGTDDNVRGNNAVASQATLTIAEPVTAADTIVINGETITFVAALTAADQILIGASEAATKLAMNAAFVDRDNGGVLHSVTAATFAAMECSAIDFAADDMVFTANVKGAAGDAITCTEGLTHASNVWDSTTFGTTTAGVDAAHIVSDIDWPTSGCWLTPGEDIAFTVTNGVAGDNFEVFLTYLEYDASIV